MTDSNRDYKNIKDIHGISVKPGDIVKTREGWVCMVGIMGWGDYDLILIDPDELSDNEMVYWHQDVEIIGNIGNLIMKKKR